METVLKTVREINRAINENLWNGGNDGVYCVLPGEENAGNHRVYHAKTVRSVLKVKTYDGSYQHPTRVFLLTPSPEIKSLLEVQRRLL